MKKPITTPQTPGILTQIVTFGKKHAVVLSVGLFACLASYILLLANQLAAVQPDQSTVDAQLSGVARPKIEESVVETILGLEDRNIDVKSIFEEARENPFSE